MTLIERFLSHVEPQADGCWHWTGHRKSNGYGQWQPTPGRKAHTHRWSYEFFVGPIPEGLVVDHLCRVRHCVNPDHLEPVTNRENILRGNSAPAENVGKTHCYKGHEFTPANTIVTARGRNCRECGRRRQREYWARKTGRAA